MDKKNTLIILEKILCKLLKCNVLPEKSYLAGGTAVYFYFKHRVSVYLDFFSPTPFNSELVIHKIKECIGHVDLALMENNTIILFFSTEKVKFSLFYFPYKNLQENRSITLMDGSSCPLASLEDIEAMKSIAISQRGSVKYFIDLFFIAQKTGHQFDDILKLVSAKYLLEKSYEYQLKTSFIYFDDAEKEVGNIVMFNDNNEAVTPPGHLFVN